MVALKKYNNDSVLDFTSNSQNQAADLKNTISLQLTNKNTPNQKNILRVLFFLQNFLRMFTPNICFISYGS